MNKLLLLLFLLCQLAAFTQVPVADSTRLRLFVKDLEQRPLSGAVVEVRRDSSVVASAIADPQGLVTIEGLSAGYFSLRVSFTGFETRSTPPFRFPLRAELQTVQLQPNARTLENVRLTSRKPFVQQKQGKTIVNVDASPTTAGSTVLETLEKSPGVAVDRNGGIVLNGKSGVLILIDDKPTYLSGADLNNLLSSMNANQVAQIELMPNPPARYDASGNAGVINIVTKKNKTRGFNGTATISAGQGFYPKNNNNLALNYRNGKWGSYLNYNLSLSKYRNDLYALRKYYDANGVLLSTLDQPANLSGRFANQTIKTGLDYAFSPKTTLGINLGTTLVNRKGNNQGTANWLSPSGNADSSISTYTNTDTRFRNTSVNLNLRHRLNPGQELSGDIDWLNYRIGSDQHFDNIRTGTSAYHEESKGYIPTHIKILSGKIDYAHNLKSNTSLNMGWKGSGIETDNTAAYQYQSAGTWVDDLTKSNHFIYRENIQAAYGSFEKKWKRLNLVAGLRYEHTHYNAHQLGNALQKDSAFSRSYGGLFPTGSLSLELDSSSSLTLAWSRRIERPAFQNLNPFYFIINKYTYQTGNPFILPQYTWNMELSHQYKSLLTTTASVSIIRNYFSQLFLTDPSRGVLLYTQGNVGQTVNAGLTAGLNLSIRKWWALTSQLTYNHKQLKGFNGNTYSSEIDQLHVNLNNQFSFGKVYTAEVSGFVITRARNDIQELLYPTGQLSLGLSRPLWKNKGTIRFNFRDILYTNAMEGLTQFPNATEYFIIRRDSRVVSLALTYRFGKAFKSTRRTGSSADDEMERVGSGG